MACRQSHTYVCVLNSKWVSKLMDRLAIKYLRRCRVACKVLEVTSRVDHSPLKTFTSPTASSKSSLPLLLALARHICLTFVAFYSLPTSLFSPPKVGILHRILHKSRWAGFHPIQVGVFVPGCWRQKAFSRSWIIQWEHPVDGAPGFETWARHSTHTQNRGLSGGLWRGSWRFTWPPTPTTSLCYRCQNGKWLDLTLLAIKPSILQHSHYICCPSALIWQAQRSRLSNHHPRCVFVGRENHSEWGVQ